jgi:VWFA-related protein
VLVLVTDGGDNASEATFEQVLREAQASNAAIYAVGVVDPLDRTANRGRLRELARATGGEAFFPRNVEDVADVLRHIAEEIRHTYTIGVVPPERRQDGAFHRLRVQVRAADRRSLTVRTREGYRATFGRAGSVR